MYNTNAIYYYYVTHILHSAKDLGDFKRCHNAKQKHSLYNEVCLMYVMHSEGTFTNLSLLIFYLDNAPVLSIAE